MKKKLLIFVLVLCLSVNAFASGYPVIDVSAIIAAIENGYTLYNQYKTLIDTLENNYKQLENQVKSFQALDLKQLDAKDPLGSWRTMMTYANRQMNYLNNIENIMNKKDMKVGNYSYSLSDFFSHPINSTKDMAKGAFEYQFFDPFVNRSPAEKAAFHSKYGMSPGNYLKYNKLTDAIMGSSAEQKATNLAIRQNLLADAERLEKIAKDGNDADGTVTKQQAQIAFQLEQLRLAEETSESMAKFYDSWNSAHIKLEVQNSQEEQNRKLSAHNYNEGFVNIIHTIKNDDMEGGRK
jgi:hypothetical protein